MEQTLDISWSAIGKFLVTGFVLFVLFLARDVIILLFFGLIISLLLDPAIGFFRWMRLPKIVSVSLVYASIFGVLGLMIYLTAPIFIFEIDQFSQNIPVYFEKISPILKDLGIQAKQNFEDFTSLLVLGLQKSSSGILQAVTTFFGGVSSTFLIFALAFFISLEESGIEKILALLAPKKYESYIVHLFERAQYKVSRWFGARILSCIFVGLASFIAFYLLDVKHAFTLALLSAFLNFVPYIGPAITLIVAVVFVGISNSCLVAVYICIIILVIQEIENIALTPLLMKKFMNLPPILVLVSLLFGGTIFGFLGTIFAVPIFGIIYEFAKEFLEKRKEEAIGL